MPSIQLEFSLLALRDDPLPALQSRLQELQAAGRDGEAAEVTMKLADEQAKRERWAVSGVWYAARGPRKLINGFICTSHSLLRLLAWTFRAASTLAV